MTPYNIFQSRSGTDSAAPTSNTTAVTGTNVYYSKMWTGLDSSTYDLEVIWAGTMTGTVILQVSDKLFPDETTDTDWVTSTEITLDNPAGSSITKRYSKTGSAAYRKRLKYTNSSGSGTVQAWATASVGA